MAHLTTLVPIPWKKHLGLSMMFVICLMKMDQKTATTCAVCGSCRWNESKNISFFGGLGVVLVSLSQVWGVMCWFVLFKVLMKGSPGADFFCDMGVFCFPQLSHEKNIPTFHYTGWLIGILIMVYYNPHTTG